MKTTQITEPVESFPLASMQVRKLS